MPGQCHTVTVRRFDPDAYGNPMLRSRSAATPAPQPRNLPRQDTVSAHKSRDADEITGTVSTQSIGSISKGQHTSPAQNVSEIGIQNHNQKPSAIRITGLQTNNRGSLAKVNVARSPGATTASPVAESEVPGPVDSMERSGKFIRGSIGHNTCVNKDACSAATKGESLCCKEPKSQSIPTTQASALESPLAANNVSESQANGKSAHTSNISNYPKTPTSSMPHSNFAATRSQPVIPLDFEDGKKLSPEASLERAREKAIRDIQLRIRARDKNNTTALQVLDLARKPVSNKKGFVEAQAAAPLAYGTQQNLGQTQSTPTLVQTTGKAPERPNLPTGQNLGHVDTHTNSPHLVSAAASQPRTSERNAAVFDRVPQTQSSANQPQDPELEAIPADLECGSNDWGSSIPSDASQASNDSTRPLHVGKLLDRRVSKAVPAHARWNPGWQPPPVDWHERPRFNNDSPEFRDDLARWKHDVYTMSTGNGDLAIKPIPPHVLEDARLVPDGLFLVMRDYTITSKNALFYGYEDSHEVTKYAQPAKESDFEDWGKLDLSRAENLSVQQETTEQLVSNWIQHTEERRKNLAVQMQQDKQALQALDDYEAAPNPNRPHIDIYLRPAVEADVPQMTNIYNWYVVHSCRTAEMLPVKESDIEARLDESETNKLPLLVAVKTDHHLAMSYDPGLGGRTVTGRSRSDSRSGFPYGAMAAKETIVGWASAQDYTAFDFVEHISAELEIFVEPTCRQMGIGRCLLDQLLEACDRGYLKRGGYPFQCEQEVRHLYSSGGGRNLHKLMFLLRKWKYPKDGQVRATKRAQPDTVTHEKLDDREDDYDTWLKAWFESWGFEVEGVLKGVGAKNGRFIDMVYFARETGWRPAEGQVPDPLPDL